MRKTRLHGKWRSCEAKPRNLIPVPKDLPSHLENEEQVCAAGQALRNANPKAGFREKDVRKQPDAPPSQSPTVSLLFNFLQEQTLPGVTLE